MVLSTFIVPLKKNVLFITIDQVPLFARKTVANFQNQLIFFPQTTSKRFYYVKLYFFFVTFKIKILLLNCIVGVGVFSIF